MTVAPEARRGRPRSAEADQAIIEATLDLIEAEGLGSLSVEAVAERAGVGKATIYRRWPSKDSLVTAALSRVNDDLPEPPTDGTTRQRLVRMLEDIRTAGRTTRVARLMPRMLSHAGKQPELFCQYYGAVIEPRRERFRAVMREGVSSGELRPDLDVEVAVTLLVAPMVYMNMMRTGMGEPPEDVAERVVGYVLDGLAAG